MDGEELTSGLRETLAVFESADRPREPRTASEIATHLDISRRSTYDRLEQLAERGLLETKKVGSKARVWWPSPDSIDATATDGAGVRSRAGGGAEKRSGPFSDSLFETQLDVVYAINDEGHLVRWNDRLCDVTGYSSVEIEETPLREFLDREAREAAAATVEAVLQGGESRTFEAGLLTADGERIPYEFSATPVCDETEGIVGATGVGRDVSDRKSTKRELQRQRDEFVRELEEVFERVDDAFIALDDDWQFTYVNDRATEVLDRTADALMGQSVWEAFPEAVDTRFQDHFERAIETQESVTFEGFYPPTETWFEVSAYPSTDGLSVYFRDITGRKERERELERFETMVQTMIDGVYVMDDDGYFVMVNDAFLEMTGYERSELLGSHGSRLVDDETIERVRELEGEMASGERESARVEAPVTCADGSTVAAEATFALLAGEDGGTQRVAVVRDVTERRERERALEESRRRYRTLVENFPNGAVGLVDEDLRYVTAGGTPISRNADSGGDLEGQTVREALPDDIAERVATRYEAALEGESSSLELEQADDYAQIQIFPVRDEDGEVFAAIGMSQDVTERRQYEHELERRVRQQEVVTDLGQRALADRDLDALLEETVTIVAETLDTEYCAVFERDPQTGVLDLRAGTGWEEGVVGEASLPAVESESHVVDALDADEPVVLEDRDGPSGSAGAAFLADHDVRAGISIPIGSTAEPWGVLGAYDTDPGSYADEDVTFLQTVATVLATAIDRRRHERELLRQRTELSALNDLHQVVHGVTNAVVAQSTRDEIERMACERLVDSESYRFAWIAEVDPRTETVRARVESGVDGYLDAIELSADPHEDVGRGPVGAAFRTGEIQVSRDVFTDPAFEPWRDAAREYGFRSFAAIPIVHEGTQYGVLGLHTDRQDAFAATERAVVGQLGEVIGHAIAAAERKRALLSEDVVQLEFRVPDAFEALDVELQPSGQITFDQMIPVGDGEFLVYGHASADAVDGVKTLVDGYDHWQSVTLRNDEGPVTFELRLSQPPVLSTLASLGGSIKEAVIDDCDYRLVVQLPRDVETKRLVHSVQDAYGDVELMRRRQLASNDHSTGDLDVALEERLTDRQLASLRSAYHAGFFEWPRDTSGEELAESLEVAPPTFHQHLRKAEQKVFDALLSDRSGT